jgi:two-component system OmpR family response regulator
MSEKLTVLVVEDELLIAVFIAGALEQAGFIPDIRQSGESAFAALDNCQFAYCALIVDIRLGPGPNGWDVARHAREVFANIPVICITADSGAEHRAYGVPCSVLVKKPFSERQIVNAVTRLLNSRPPSR